MSLLRPEIAQALRTWREALVWGAALGIGAALGLRGALYGEWLVLILGLGLAATGLALGRGALARLRLGTAPAGPGLVAIDEARIGILGPREGGYVDLDDLVQVAITGRPGGPDRAWVLQAAGGQRLVIPFGAQGAERLPDALAALPGIDFAAAGQGAGIVWQRAHESLGRS